MKPLIFAFTVFLGAFLIFGVQPMAARRLLPLFGGTPAVWSTAMLFFQMLLLAGYAYAHLLSRRRPAAQGSIHLAALVAAAALLVAMALLGEGALNPGASTIMDAIDSPTLSVLALLGISIGPPFFVLSASGPLLQAWFARSFPAIPPYRLYALSNVGSLVALLGYPFIVEPALPLRTQAAGWTALFVIFGLLVAACALLHARAGTTGTGERPVDTGAPRPTPRAVLIWLLLAACASSLLLSTTNQMSQEVAVVPFLWVLPLALYLLSFVLSFERPLWYFRPVWIPLLILGTLATAYVLYLGHDAGIVTQVAAYCATLMGGCMICHGELARRRPHPAHLTGFYLVIAVGGALGGTFVSLVAARVFSTYWEYPLSLLGCCLALSLILLSRRPSRFATQSQIWIQRTLAFLLLTITVPVFHSFWTTTTDTLLLRRTFYGILSVGDLDEQRPAHRRVLWHGRTVHGFQYLDESMIDTPTTYYHEGSAVGATIEALRLVADSDDPPRPLRIGVVGLGIGTIAAYGREGDVIRFYEINPEVIRLARPAAGLFRFLERSEARIDIVLGDARLSLEREIARGEPQDYDLLVIDAFSSGAIPIHLLTLESLRVYLEHLRNPGGVLAVHISNRYLDLEPVVRTLARRLECPAFKYSSGGGDTGAGYSSSYMILARSDTVLPMPRIVEEEEGEEDTSRYLWTDDYSNLKSVLVR